MRRKYSALSELPNLFINACKRSLEQGNVSQTSVILFTGGGCLDREPPGQTHPIQRPPGQRPLGQRPPCKERVVRILLECILVWFLIGSLWQRDWDTGSRQEPGPGPIVSLHWWQFPSRTVWISYKRGCLVNFTNGTNQYIYVESVGVESTLLKFTFAQQVAILTKCHSE